MPNLGLPEIILILAVLLLLFGAKRLPEIGKSMGKGLREFKSATKGLADDVKDGMHDDELAPPSPKAAEPKAAEPKAAEPKAKGPAE